MTTTQEELLLTDLKFNGDIVLDDDGNVVTVKGLENLKQALLHRLITFPGSLAHRPEYGVGIQEFQNSLNSLDNQRLLANRIVENFRREPRVKEVTSVQVVPNEDPFVFQIVVKVLAIGREEVESLEFTYRSFAEGIQIS